MTTLECVEWDFFLMRICALTLDVERSRTMVTEIFLKNRKLSWIYPNPSSKIVFTPETKKAGTEDLSIRLGICELSFIKFTL